jgi:hypothetical protein
MRCSWGPQTRSYGRSRIIGTMGRSRREELGSGLTLDEACTFLRCSRATLHRERAAGVIKPDGYVGTRPRFSIASLREYLHRRRDQHAGRGAR